MIELAALATSLVSSFLIPYVKKGAEGLLEEVESKATDSAAEGIVNTAKKLWARLRGAKKEPDEDAVMALFEKNPDRMKSAMEDVVRGILERDEQLRQEASDLLEQKTDDGRPQWQLMGEIVGAVDARNAAISGNANVAGVTYYAAAPPPRGPAGAPQEAPAPGSPS